MSRFDKAKLQKRILSALVLAVLTFWAIWNGGIPFLLFIVILGGIAFFEWFQMGMKANHKVLFLLAGLIYIPLCFSSFYMIRDMYGLYMALLFVLMVWSSDIGAYFLGKFFGGPKMSTSISPNKTWAGYMGAIISPALVGCVFVLLSKSAAMFDSYTIAMLVGAAIGVVGQSGDLLISWFKRHAHVKDTGHLIPGHGGILDRIDAMMLSGPVFLFALKKFSDVLHV